MSTITFLPLRSWGQSLPLSQILDWLLCKREYIHDCAGLGQIALKTDVLPTYSQRCHSQSPPWARQRWGWSTRHLCQGLGNIPRTKWVLGEPHVISFLNWVHFKRISFFLCPDQTCQISISITIRVFKGQGVHLGVRGKSVGVPKDQMAKCKLWIINDKSPIAYHK